MAVEPFESKLRAGSARPAVVVVHQTCVDRWGVVILQKWISAPEAAFAAPPTPDERAVDLEPDLARKRVRPEVCVPDHHVSPALTSVTLWKGPSQRVLIPGAVTTTIRSREVWTQRVSRR